jgi:protein-histidine N-methyltransferase
MKESDKVVLETILSIFSPMLEALLPEQDDPNRCCFMLKPIFCGDAIHRHHHLPALVHPIPCRESASWDVKLASDYKDLQRKIVSSIVTSCTSALENL